MKKKSITLFLGLFLSCVFVFGFMLQAKTTKIDPLKIGEDLYVEQIEDKTYVVTHEFPWAANSLVVEMEDSSILLVDTPYTPAATEDLLTWVDKKFGKRKIAAINTGFHFDNLGGNEVLVKKNIPVYGSTLTAKLTVAGGEASRKLMVSWLSKPENKKFHDAYEKISSVNPTLMFDLSKPINIGFSQQEIEIYYPGESHSPDNLVVYFPKKKLLFGGCMVKSLESTDLGNTADANMKEWPNSLKKVLQRYKDAKIVVPGHGKSGTTEMIQHTIDLFK